MLEIAGDMKITEHLKAMINYQVYEYLQIISLHSKVLPAKEISC